MNRRLLILFGLGLSFALTQPLQNRILIARSPDGLDWQRTNIIFCDSADVPDAVRGPDDRFFVYYQGLWDPFHDGIMVAISSDGMTNWERHRVTIPGTETWPGKPCDPDIILFGDTFRLYFTGDPANDHYPETYSAVSLDGWSFTLEPGVRFEVLNQMVLDPSLVWTGDTLQYFAGGAPTPFANWHAHSLDGINFARQPDVMVDSLMFANGLALDSGYRFYGFRNMPPCGIKSLFSPDGSTWTLEPGWRLQLDSTNPLEYRYVKDAAVVRTDSGFIMFYATRKREAGLEENRQPPASRSRLTTTVVRNTLVLPGAASPHSTYALFSSAGRKVLDLHLGPNTLRHLAPGVFFLWERSAQNGRKLVLLH